MKPINVRVRQAGPSSLAASLRMPQFRRSLLAIACCPTLVTGALAATSDATPETSDAIGGDIVVTASRYAQKIADVPESISVISAAQIADTPGYTLDDVLRTVPGVNLPFAPAQQIHPTSDIVSMRGLSGHRALVLLDGIPINDAFFAYVQWSRVSLASVDRVEVVRGGDATLWGDHAMGGVINILTRVATHDELAVDIGGGSFGTYRGDVYGAYVASPKAVFSADVNYNKSAGFQQYPADVRLPVSRATRSSAYNVNLSGDFKPWDGMTSGVKVSRNEFDQSPLNELVSTNHQQIWNVTGFAKQNFAYDMDLAFNVFHTRSRFTTANAGSTPGTVAGSAEYIQNLHLTDANDTGGSLVFSQAVSDWLKSYSVGVDAHRINGQDAAVIYDDTTLTPIHARTDVGKGAQLFLGTFVQGDFQPIKNLDVNLAARYQDFKNTDAYDGTPGGLGNVPKSTEGSFDPRVSAKYAFIPEFDVRVAAYKAFNAPTLEALYRAYSVPAGIFYANPNLTPEKLKGAEIGFDAMVGPVSAQVTYYYNKINNLISSETLTAAELPPGFFFGSRNINAGKAISKGVETAFQYKIMTGLSADFTYTYANSVVTSNPVDPKSVGLQVQNVPRYQMAAGIDYVAPAKWRLAADARYIDTTYGDSDNTLVLPAHLVVDLSGAYPITDKIETYLQLSNILNRRYIAFNDGASPMQFGQPFGAFLGFRAKFE